MMKKNGFTLAEVLITLAIIGVVATLTLPALMTNTNEQQMVTALKKGINTLSEAAQMSESLTGFDYSSLTSNSTEETDVNEASLYSLLFNRAKIDDARSAKTTDDKIKAIKNFGAAGEGDDNYVVFFADGMSLSFKPEDTAGDTGKNDGFYAILDVNGGKAPNILSNCKNNKKLNSATVIPEGGGSEAAVAAEFGSDTDCSDKSLRVIRDQFPVHLIDSRAIPSTAPGRWVMGN